MGVGRALDGAGLTGAVYADVHDPRGIGVVLLDENPDVFVAGLRELFLKPPLASLRLRPEHALLSDLRLRLRAEPGRLAAPATPARDPGRGRPLGRLVSLAPPGGLRLAAARGAGGHPASTATRSRPHLRRRGARLKTSGWPASDWTGTTTTFFVIGLLGRDLHPLSACIQAMRSTRQTSQYMQHMGPFFVGRTLWQSPLRP